VIFSVFAGLFSGMYIFMRDRVAELENIV